MFKKTLATTAALALFAGAAQADLMHTIELSSVSGNDYTFTVTANVTNMDDWTSSAAAVNVLDMGVTLVPNELIPAPGTPVTFFSSPGAVLGIANFADGPNEVLGESISATWFDTQNLGDGDYLIFQFTLTSLEELTLMDTGAVAATLEGTTTAASTGGELLPFGATVYVVPAPGAVALLGLAGLVGTRRRRG